MVEFTIYRKVKKTHSLFLCLHPNSSNVNFLHDHNVNDQLDHGITVSPKLESNSCFSLMPSFCSRIQSMTTLCTQSPSPPVPSDVWQLLNLFFFKTTIVVSKICVRCVWICFIFSDDWNVVIFQNTWNRLLTVQWSWTPCNQLARLTLITCVVPVRYQQCSLPFSVLWEQVRVQCPSQGKEQ